VLYRVVLQTNVVALRKDRSTQCENVVHSFDGGRVEPIALIVLVPAEDTSFLLPARPRLLLKDSLDFVSFDGF
jgi:hypothetical protein